jgi:hypothetical protein
MMYICNCARTVTSSGSGGLNPMLGKPTVFYNAINRLHVCPTVSRTFSSAKLEVV